MFGLKKRIRDAASDFCSVSTIAGVKDLHETQHVPLKIIWAAAICASMGFFVYQSKLLLNAYQQESTAVGIENVFGDEDKALTVVYCSDNFINIRQAINVFHLTPRHCNKPSRKILPI